MNEKTTRDPVQKRSMLKKQSIMEAGISLFSERGYFKTCSKDIAKAAGVSTGTFYAYFEDKKALFIHLINVYKSAVSDAVKETLLSFTPDNDKVLIDKLMHRILEIAEAYPGGFHSQILILNAMDEDINRIYSEHREEIRKLVEGLLDGKTNEGLKVSGYTLSSFIVHLNEKIIDMVIREENQTKRNEILDLYSKILSTCILKY